MTDEKSAAEVIAQIKRQREQYTREEARAILFMKIGRACTYCCPDRACRRAHLCLRYYERCLMLPAKGVDASITREEWHDAIDTMFIREPPSAGTLEKVRRAKRPIVERVRRQAKS
jgi:hypothetical protein